MPKQYEYREMMYLHHAQREGLDRLNELGAKGWAPAFEVGRTLILVREVEGDDASAPLREATIDEWRDVYEGMDPGALAEIDGDTVGEIMEAKGYSLPTKTTLNRWADEARESVGGGE